MANIGHMVVGGGIYQTPEKHTAVRILPVSGTLNAGIVRLYGVRG